MIVPCPECGKQEGYDDVGPFRTQCVACGAPLKHAEVKPGGTARSPVVETTGSQRDA